MILIRANALMIPLADESVVRHATPGDWLYIDALRKKEGSALGFIPKDAYLSCLSGVPVDGRRRWEYQEVLVTEDNGDLTGFCYASFILPTAKIFQIVIQEDARRWYRASLIEGVIRQDAIRRAMSGITCRVAMDLESNYFWRALGYIPIKEVKSTWLNQRESKCKRPLWEYYLPLDLPMFSERE